MMEFVHPGLLVNPTALEGPIEARLLALLVLTAAVSLYMLLLWASRLQERRAKVRCPQRGTTANVRVRLDAGGKPCRVLVCSLLGRQCVTCSEACLRSLA